MTVLRGAAWAFALLAGGLVVGGCTPDDPEPTPTTPVETNSSAPKTSEPTVAAPEMPAEALSETPEGAASFMQHWIALMNYAYASGDVSPLEAANHPDCIECSGLITDFRTSLEGGNRLEGGRVTVANVVPGEVASSDGTTIVSASFEQAEATSISPSGEVVETLEATPSAPVAFYCLYADGEWKMRRVVAIQ